MQRLTHAAIDRSLSGEPIELREGFARLHLTVSDRMRADERGLAHGGFLFCLADHAAMLAVNQPTVVLGSAQMRFLRPVTVGDELIAEASLIGYDGAKRIVAVDVSRGGEVIARAEMVCFTPDRHVLEGPAELLDRHLLLGDRVERSAATEQRVWQQSMQCGWSHILCMI